MTKRAEVEVELIDHMGDDDRVVDAARVSLARRASQFSPEANAKLIRYLAEHGHFTPFTHPQATFYIRAPIFVARQLFKSKVGFQGGDELDAAIGEAPFTENEVSRRYVDSTPEVYEPAWRMRAPGVKQGSGPPMGDGAAVAGRTFHIAVVACLRAYDHLLRLGVAPEQARAVLQVATFTDWFWTGSLAAWARLYRLRTAPDAQGETCEVARRVGELLAPLYPVSWAMLTRSRHAD